MNSKTPDLLWRLDPLPASTQCLSLDIVASVPNTLSDGYSTFSRDFSRLSSPAAMEFVSEYFQAKDNEPKHGVCIKLLVSNVDGFVVQSDFLQRRLVDCANVVKTTSFMQPGQQIRQVPKEALDSRDLVEIAGYTIGGLVLHSPPEQSIQDCSRNANEELGKRISFPWLSQQPIPRRRMAVIGGRSLSALQGYTTAAESLNISLVVLDEPTHWLAGSEWSHLREDFVPFDMTADENMPQRIANTLRKYSKTFDGVMTIEEHLLTLVSKAVELMSLPTSPSASVGMAQNKYQTRQLDNNVYCSHVTCPSGLDELLKRDGPQLKYPLIIKPSRGWASEGVFKVGNESDLRDAIGRLWRDSFTAWHGNEVVIETYVDGPEVDANMILLDGEILFFEVNDDFPSPGDSENASCFANFVEDSNMIPSRLPQEELENLKQSLRKYLLKAGFRSGVFHMEARLRNSSHYFTKKENGLIDLVEKPNPSNLETEIFLLEINPRAPGMQEINATDRAYGVSYCTLSLLNALADKERMKALSQPFLGGAQYHLEILFIPAERGGVYKSGDVCTEVLQRFPEFRPNVAECMSFLKNGQEVPDPKTGSMTWVAFFLIYSRVSREDALRIGLKVKAKVRNLIEECN